MVVEGGGGQNLDAVLADARQGDSGGTRSQVSARERRQRFGVAGGIVLLATPPGSSGLGYAVERALFDRGGSVVLLSAAGGRWLSGAKAVADAGLLAIVSVEPSALEEQRVRVADDPRLLVVDASGESVVEGAKRVLAALSERGWLGAS